MDCTEWLTACNQEELDALLDAHGPQLRVHVVGAWDGDMRLEGRELHALDMSGTHLRGTVYATQARIGEDLFACGARIGGSLILERARIGRSVSADHASIGGAVDASRARIGRALTYRSAHIASGIVMPDVMHGVPGRAIAQSDGYILWRDRRDCYWAGCRGPYTREQALRHWDRDDERARVFREAILARSRGRDAIQMKT
jgi:hypothetical protein